MYLILIFNASRIIDNPSVLDVIVSTSSSCGLSACGWHMLSLDLIRVSCGDACIWLIFLAPFVARIIVAIDVCRSPFSCWLLLATHICLSHWVGCLANFHIEPFSHLAAIQ